MPTSPAHPAFKADAAAVAGSAAPLIGRALQVARVAATFVVALAALLVFANPWSADRTSREFPDDWLALWGGERSDAYASNCVPLRVGQGHNWERVETDIDGAYSVGDPATWVDLGHIGGSQIWTVAAWFRITASAYPLPNYRFVVAGGVGYPEDWFLFVEPRSVGAVIGVERLSDPPPESRHDRRVPPWAFSVPLDFTLGEWVHLAATFDRKNVVIYANGQAIGTTVHPNPDQAAIPGLMMGRDPWARRPPQVHRQTDDIVVYDRVLRPTEVAQLAAGGRGGPFRILDQRTGQVQRRETAGLWLPWACAVLAMAWILPGQISWWWRTVFFGDLKRSKEFLSVAMVVLVGMSATAGTVWAALAWRRGVAERRFAADTQQFRELVDGTFEKLMSALVSMRTQLEGADRVTRTLWNRALAGINREDLQIAWPLAYAEYVAPGQRREHEDFWKAELGPYYRTYAVSPEAPPSSEDWDKEALPVVLARPYPRSPLRHPSAEWCDGRDLLGKDPADPNSELLARIAKEALVARRSAPPAEMFTTAIPGASERGLMLFLPLRPLTEGHAPLRGLILAGCRPGAMLEHFFGSSGPEFGIHCSWETDGVPALTAIQSAEFWPKTRKPDRPWLRRQEAIPLYGSRLKCEYWTTPQFDADYHRRTPWFLVVLGLGLSAMAARSTATQVAARLDQAQAAEALRAANSQLAAASRSKARLSRDLHDGTIQTLYALGLELRHLRNLLPDQAAQVNAELGGSLTTLQGVIADLRHFILELEPDALKEISLVGAMEQIAARLRRTTPLDIRLEIDLRANEISSSAAIHILNLVREALSNTLRHAKASRAWVELHWNHHWRLVVGDDGQGFEPGIPSRPQGRGLRSFVERSMELNGHCQIESQPGKGTRLTVDFRSPPSDPSPPTS